MPSSSEANTIARLFNSTINNSTTLFHPLHDRQNRPIQGFPHNGEALSNLNGKEYNLILKI